jgi:L-ascorbate metabolism protein UlaG (beta-lactamase superfamily)
VRITYVGHATVLIEIDGLRVLTDPLLRPRVAHMVRAAGPVDGGSLERLDLVLVSHMHHDHFDRASLGMIGGDPRLVVPRRGGRAARRLQFGSVTELGAGQELSAGGVTIAATPAVHRLGRLLDRRSEAIGYTVTGAQRVYFAGDTDVFPKMSELQGGLDVALLPVGGWGPKVGPGHLNPERAAEALALLSPRIAIPIHWGTLRRVALRSAIRTAHAEAPWEFAREAAKRAPHVEVRVLQPGEATDVEPA